jgi:hypothetical protein
MVAAKPRHRCDAVDQRHMQVDHDRVGIEIVRLLNRFEAVFGEADDTQLGLPVDQLPERVEEGTVVICE